MEIKGTEDLTPMQIKSELENGAKFVVYQYCVSIVIITFKRSSDIYFIRAGNSAAAKGLGFTLVSLLFGWWGIPWGPIYTIGSLVNNLSGGKDVTQAVLSTVTQQQSAD